MILKVNHFGIDVLTKHSAYLRNRLKVLKSTESVVEGGAYWEDRHYSQVHLDTTWTEDELDAWLYNTKGVEAVGIFSREAA